MKTNFYWFCQAGSMSQIIKLVFPTLLLLQFSFKPATESKNSKLTIVRKEINVANNFKRIRIDGDVTVVLTNEPGSSFIIEGMEKDVNKIRYTIKNNKLFIDAQRKNSFSELTIYLPAVSLQSIQINGDADVSSNEIIRVDDLRILLNGCSSVKVRTTGRLSFDAPDEYELSWGAPVSVK